MDDGRLWQVVAEVNAHLLPRSHTDKRTEVCVLQRLQAVGCTVDQLCLVLPDPRGGAGQNLRLPHHSAQVDLYIGREVGLRRQGGKGCSGSAPIGLQRRTARRDGRATGGYGDSADCAQEFSPADFWHKQSSKG